MPASRRLTHLGVKQPFDKKMFYLQTVLYIFCFYSSVIADEIRNPRRYRVPWIPCRGTG